MLDWNSIKFANEPAAIAMLAIDIKNRINECAAGPFVFTLKITQSIPYSYISARLDVAHIVDWHYQITREETICMTISEAILEDALCYASRVVAANLISKMVQLGIPVIFTGRSLVPQT